MLNKAIVGIIAGIIIVGVIIGYSVGSEEQEVQEIEMDDDSEPVPQGRNITIELSDGLSFSASP